MNKKENIESLYFEGKKSLTEISRILNLSIGYVSRILKQNENYAEEKQRRSNEKLARRRDIQKEMIYKQRKQKETDLSYMALQNQHEQDVKELSKNSRIGTEALRRWCSNAYKYNPRKNRFEFDAGNAVKPADFPQYIKI